MPLYTKEEVEVYTRMLARAYDVVRDFTLDLSGDNEARGYLLKQIERTMGWNVPPPAKAKPPPQIMSKPEWMR